MGHNIDVTVFEPSAHLRKRVRRQRKVDEDGVQLVDVTIPPESVARTICLNLLTAAPRSRDELATALRKRRVPDDVAQAVLDRLTDGSD